MKSPKLMASIAIVALGLSGCSDDVVTVYPQTNTLQNQLRELIISRSGGEGLAAFNMPDSDELDLIPQDPANPLTPEKVALGQMLFHDTAFSLAGRSGNDGTWSCATCHHAAAGFKSGIKQGIGEGGIGFGDNGQERVLSSEFDAMAASDAINLPDIQPVTSPSTLNVAYQDVMLWNGQFGHAQNGIINIGVDANLLMTPGTPKAANKRRLSGVETQAVAGLGVHRMKVDWQTPLQTNSTYIDMFDAAYPSGSTDKLQDAALAIAAFERTLLANESPFQRWLDGEASAMSTEELRGALLFFGKADCVACHTGPALSSMPGATADDVFFALGMSDFDSSTAGVHGVVSDDVSKGRGGFTQIETDNFKFKVPQLYNLADAPVFGHGGSFDTIRSVLEYKNKALSQNAAVGSQIDSRFIPLNLSDGEIDDLAAFLAKALHDPNLMRYEPSSVPSGGCVVVDQLQVDAGARCPN